MATTTNYGWETPDDTDLVKDGALAQRTTASSIDTTLFTALGGAYPGLRLVKKQTIGISVSSVTVTNAFSSTYENYKIIVSGGAAASAGSIPIRLGATTTGYYGGLSAVRYSNATAVLAADNNGASFSYAGQASPNGLFMGINLLSPFLTKNTLIQSIWTGTDTTSSSGAYGGFLNNTTSYTDFTISATGGAWTGGTIYVYGYGAS